MFHFFWGLSLIIIITKEFLKHGPQAILRRAGAKQHGQPAICKRFNQYLTVPNTSENSMSISHIWLQLYSLYDFYWIYNYGKFVVRSCKCKYLTPMHTTISLLHHNKCIIDGWCNRTFNVSNRIYTIYLLANVPSMEFTADHFKICSKNQKKTFKVFSI